MAAIMTAYDAELQRILDDMNDGGISAAHVKRGLCGQITSSCVCIRRNHKDNQHVCDCGGSWRWGTARKFSAVALPFYQGYYDTDAAEKYARSCRVVDVKPKRRALPSGKASATQPGGLTGD